MKSWVSSAFGDLGSSSSQTPLSKSTTRAIRTPATVATTSRSTQLTRTAKTFEPENILRSQQPTATKKLGAQRSPLKDKTNELSSLSEKYAPASRSELVVNKAKIDQLSSLVDDLVARKKGSILLIDGPTGCGKTCTLKVLCKEKNVDLVTWSNLSLNLTSFDPESAGLSELDIGNESQVKLFQQFLFKSSRYESAQLFSSGSQQENNSSSQTNRKLLLLVKEIPNVFYRDGGRNQLGACLRQFVKYSKHSIVFVLTQGSSSTNECNPNRLFTSDLRKELSMIELSFNAIANTFLIKHVERVAKSEGFSVDKSFLEGLCQVANGDIRNAINTLEIACVSTANKVASNLKLPFSQLLQSQSTAKRGVAKKRKQQNQNDVIVLDEDSNSKESELSNQFENSSKNINYTIFRGLGKILHRKNMEESEMGKSEENRSRVEGEKRLPAHLKSSKQRPPLGFNPDELSGKIPLSSELLIAYLFQNYLDLFKVKASASRASFDSTFESLDSIAESFMCADYVCRKSSIADLGCGSESKLKEMASLVAIRSVLYNMWFGDTENCDTTAKSSKGQWLPLYKPFGTKLNETKLRREKIANELLMNVIACESSEFDFNLVDMKREFFTTYLPYILIRASKSTNRLPQLQLNNYISRADYAILAAKPRPVNTKFSAQTNENDYADEEEEENTNFAPPKAASEQSQSQTQRQPQQQTQVKQQAQKTTNNGEKQIMKKGTYLYDDLLGDSPIDPF